MCRCQRFGTFADGPRLLAGLFGFDPIGVRLGYRTFLVALLVAG